MALEICRICGGDKELKNILDQGPEIIEKLLKCANIQIYIEDLLPKLICQQCDVNLDLSYRLRKQSEATQRRLRRELKEKQNQPEGAQEPELESHIEEACDFYKEEEQFVEADVPNFFQTVQLPPNVLEGHSLETVEEPCDIDEQEEFVMIDNNIESTIIAGKVLVEGASSESFEVYGSLEPRLTSITEQNNCAYVVEPTNEVHQIFNNEIIIEDDNAVDNTNTILQNLTEEIIIEDDEDKTSEIQLNQIDEGNANKNHAINEASRTESVVEHCSIDLVTSSDSTTEDCEEESELQDSLNNDGFRRLTCITCHEIFSTKQEYSEHIRQHGLERYQCIQCCKFFPTRYRLARHEEIHTEVPLQQCPYCQRSYRMLYNLERHVKSVHSNSKKFNCHICNISYSRVDVLRRHMRLHSDKKEYTCTVCSQSFKTLDYLRCHSRKHNRSEGTANQENTNTSRRQLKEDNTNKYQCTDCGNLFKSSFSLRNHLRIHTNERPHECETCHKKFRTSSALSTHQRIHSDYRPYKCEICFKNFKQSSHLKEHKMLHLGGVPQHGCTICQAKFLKKGNLKAHMRTHTKEKPFSCAECSKAFAFMQVLKRHAKIVHGRRVDYCDTSKNIHPSEDTESEHYDYIDSVADDDFQGDDVVELIEDNQAMYPSSSNVQIQNSECSQISQIPVEVVINEPALDYIHIDSSNSTKSLPPVESDIIENITEEEFQITEQNVEVFITEETKFTSYYNMGDIVQGKLF